MNNSHDVMTIYLRFNLLQHSLCPLIVQVVARNYFESRVSSVSTRVAARFLSDDAAGLIQINRLRHLLDNSKISAYWSTFTNIYLRSRDSILKKQSISYYLLMLLQTGPSSRQKTRQDNSDNLSKGTDGPRRRTNPKPTRHK